MAALTTSTLLDLLSDDDIGQDLITSTFASSLPQLLGGRNYQVQDEIVIPKTPRATIADELWPAADIKIWSKQILAPNEPLPTEHFRMEVSGRFSEWMRNYEAIYQMATELHERLVAGLVKDRQTDQPNFGRF